jgi:glutamine synthetase adenylyltransferase
LAKRAAFEPELLEMRRRIEQSETLPSFKSGPGGAYDLDFLLGMLQARHQLWLAGNLRERLRLALAHGLLEEEEYAILNECALLLRTVEHLVRLVTGRSRKWLPVAEHEYRTVQTLLNHAVGGDGEPEQHLGRVLQPAREIYLKYCDR